MVSPGSGVYPPFSAIITQLRFLSVLTFFVFPMAVAQCRLAGYDEGRQQQHHSFDDTFKATCSGGLEV